MDYGKLNNDTLRLSPSTLIIKSPSSDILTLLGYLPVQYTDKPVTEQGYHAEVHYRIENETIVQYWEIVADEGGDDDPAEETFEEEFQRRIAEVF